jgi:hypothetical protein
MISICIGSVLLASGCSSISSTTNNSSNGFPVFIPVEYFLQISSYGDHALFPFEEGERIEYEGNLIFHGNAHDTLRTKYSQVTWFASLYPRGRPISMDILKISLHGLDEKSYELEWPIDKDDFLLILSDQEVPREIFPNPQIGNSSQVCITLRIEKAEKNFVDDKVELLIFLKPDGVTRDDLIHSEIRLCDH